MVSDGETGGRRNWNLLLEAPRKYYRRHDTVKAPETFLLLKSKQKDTEGRKCAYDTERGRKKPKEKLNKESRKVVTNLKGLRERKEKEDEMGRLIYPPAERGGRPAD